MPRQHISDGALALTSATTGRAVKADTPVAQSSDDVGHGALSGEPYAAFVCSLE